MYPFYHKYFSVTATSYNLAMFAERQTQVKMNGAILDAHFKQYHIKKSGSQVLKAASRLLSLIKKAAEVKLEKGT